MLIFVGTIGKNPIGPVWLSADTTAFRALDSAAAEPDPTGRAGLTPLIRVLNVLGARGWELVNAPSNREAYVFKREVSTESRKATTR